MSNIIANYTGRSIGKVEVPATTEEEINRMVYTMLRERPVFTVKEGAANGGDVANINFEGFIDDVAFEGGKGDDYDLELGSGQFIPGFEDQLIGHSAGEDVDVKVSFPENYGAPNLAGKPAVFKCHINAVKEKTIPELTEEFCQANGLGSVEQFRARIADTVYSEKANKLGSEFMDKLINEIIKESQLEVPAEDIDARVKESVVFYSRQVANMGMTIDEYLEANHVNKEDFHNGVRLEAEFSVKVDIIYAHVAEKEGFKVEDAALNAELDAIKAYYKLTDEQFEQFKSSRAEEVRKDMLKNQITTFLFENNN